MDTIEKLRELLRGMTPGPWKADTYDDPRRIGWITMDAGSRSER